MLVGIALCTGGSTKFPAIHPMDELTSRENNAAVVKKAQQHIYVLRRWKTVEPTPVGSILTYCISSWFGNNTVEVTIWSAFGYVEYRSMLERI